MINQMLYNSIEQFYKFDTIYYKKIKLCSITPYLLQNFKYLNIFSKIPCDAGL